MKWCFLVLLLLTYGHFTRAALLFFKTPDGPARRSKAVVSTFGTVSMILQAGSAFVSREALAWNSVLAFVFVGTALVLFLSTQKALRSSRLSFAFSKKHSSQIIRRGPYLWVRHPIYLAYSLCWMGGFAFAPGWASAFPLLTLVPLYASAIMREEKQFLSGRLARQYSAYRKSTGCVFPRILG
jgi:protein-S-isoprenylcysteine O-methyltransferase Ste14